MIDLRRYSLIERRITPAERIVSLHPVVRMIFQAEPSPHQRSRIVQQVERLCTVISKVEAWSLKLVAHVYFFRLPGALFSSAACGDALFQYCVTFNGRETDAVVFSFENVFTLKELVELCLQSRRSSFAYPLLPGVEGKQWSIHCFL